VVVLLLLCSLLMREICGLVIRSWCVCVCIYVCIHSFVFTFFYCISEQRLSACVYNVVLYIKHTHIETVPGSIFTIMCVPMCMCVCVFECICVLELCVLSVYVCLSVCVCVCVCMCMCVCVCVCVVKRLLALSNLPTCTLSHKQNLLQNCMVMDRFLLLLCAIACITPTLAAPKTGEDLCYKM